MSETFETPQERSACDSGTVQVKNGGGGNGQDEMRQSTLPIVNSVSSCAFLDLLKLNVLPNI